MKNLITQRTSQPNPPDLPNPAGARCGMDNIQHLNTLVGNTINNQVCIQNNIAVTATLGGNMTTFGVRRVPLGKRIQRHPYFLSIAFSLGKSKLFKRIFVNPFTACIKFIADYIRLARNSFLHNSNFLSASSMVINSPSSMLRICSNHSSCVAWNGTLGFHLAETEGDETEYATAGSSTVIRASSGVLYDFIVIAYKFLTGCKDNKNQLTINKEQ